MTPRTDPTGIEPICCCNKSFLSGFCRASQAHQGSFLDRPIPDYRRFCLLALLVNPVIGILVLVCNTLAKRCYVRREFNNAQNLYMATIILGGLSIFTTITAVAVVIVLPICRPEPLTKSPSCRTEFSFDWDIMEFFQMDKELFCMNMDNGNTRLSGALKWFYHLSNTSLGTRRNGASNPCSQRHCDQEINQNISMPVRTKNMTLDSIQNSTYNNSNNSNNNDSNKSICNTTDDLLNPRPTLMDTQPDYMSNSINQNEVSKPSSTKKPSSPSLCILLRKLTERNADGGGYLQEYDAKLPPVFRMYLDEHCPNTTTTSDSGNDARTEMTDGQSEPRTSLPPPDTSSDMKYEGDLITDEIATDDTTMNCDTDIDITTPDESVQSSNCQGFV